MHTAVGGAPGALEEFKSEHTSVREAQPGLLKGRGKLIFHRFFLHNSSKAFAARFFYNTGECSFQTQADWPGKWSQFDQCLENS